MASSGPHMSVAGGLPRAVERAVVHRCEALQIFAKNASQWRGRSLPRRKSASSARSVAAARHHAGRLARQLSDQPRHDDAGAARGSRSRRWATSSIAPKRSACSASCCIRAATRPAAKPTVSQLIAEALLELLRARPRGRTMVLLEHTAGQGTSLGASFEHLAAIIAKMHGHRARRRLPRHLPPARLRLRHLLAGRLRDDVQAVRPAGRIRPAEGVSPQRLEEAARQPRRSP